ncbi:hypothetical protein [Veronia pacifica]|uniref:Uncharacterized protein n=1 Tax=Veronia pacifica TaxID=1080227 RepID=A0A1C3EFJ9_9GAMM|nr:hypothetical protein [Veronia pacifica]ODA32032.1 hypothetical protein A8L45_14570 [Veronia pacifica]
MCNLGNNLLTIGRYEAFLGLHNRGRKLLKKPLTYSKRVALYGIAFVVTVLGLSSSVNPDSQALSLIAMLACILGLWSEIQQTN